MKKTVKCIILLEISNLLFALATILFSKIVQEIMDNSFDKIRLCIFVGVIMVAFATKYLHMNDLADLLQRKKKSIVNRFFGTFQEINEETYLAKIVESDVPLIVEYENCGIPTLLSEIVILGVYFSLIVKENPYFAFVVLLMGVAQIVLPIYFANKFSANYEAVVNLEEKIEKLYYVYISNFKKIWFFKTKYALERLRRLNLKYYTAGKKSEKTVHVYNALMNMLDVVTQFGLCYIGIVFVSKTDMTLPILLSLFVLSDQILIKFQVVFEIVKGYKTYCTAKNRVGRIVSEQGNQKCMPKDFSEIEIRALKPDFLDYHIDAKMLKGEKWLVKGHNGGGKSTFVKVIMNLEIKYRGEVLIDDKNVLEMDVSGLFFYVKQHLMDIDFKVRELLGEHNESEIREMFADFGLDMTVLGKKYRELSTGQQKKVQLIGAFLSKKPILVLDEPENSLDELSKAVLKKNICNYTGSVIVVSNCTEYESWCERVLDVCISN